MRRILKTIGLLAFFSAIAGLIFNIVKAVRLKEEYEEFEGLDDEDDEYIIKQCIFDSLEEKVDVTKKEFASLVCHFGGMELYLYESDNDIEELVVDVDLSFGGLRLFVPSDWEVTGDMSCIVGGVETPIISSDQGKKTLYLTGKVLFGGVEVSYVDSE